MNRRAFLKVAAGAPVMTAGLRPRLQVAGEERTIEGIRLCWCPPGRFVMGSPLTEADHRADEAQVDVTITRGYWTAKFEVTQGQWQRIVGDFPERPPTDEFGKGDDVPLYWVNYPSAERFCARATEAAKRSGSKTARIVDPRGVCVTSRIGSPTTLDVA
jgi:formylglycine-generating enzyme required for sulfatase activity